MTIDYFFKWADEATAIADASGTIYYTPGSTVRGVAVSASWHPHRVIPNVKVWLASQDVGGVHTFLTGWFAIVSLEQILPSLINHAALQLALDRDAINAGRAGILKNNVGVNLQDIRFAPVFAGARYPFGALI